MNEVETQREILNQVIKKTIGRIKELQKQLEVEKKERKELGNFEDCGSFYQEAVIKTEAVISELIGQKISLEKWRGKLKYKLGVCPDCKGTGDLSGKSQNSYEECSMCEGSGKIIL